VTDPTQVEFPAKDPTTAQLTQRLDREVPRLSSAIAAEQRSAKKNADSAKTIGYIGVGVGALALILAAIALASSRRRPAGARRNEAARATTASKG
jgi:hypothetical protein